MMHPEPRFLDLYHLGQVGPEAIDDYIEQWHTGMCSGHDRHVQLHVFLGLTWYEYARWGAANELPTAEEHRQTRADAVEMQVDGHKMMVRVHPPSRCRAPCPIHYPSDHPLAGAPMWWDPLEGIMMRICPHDLDHPDPDDQQVRLHPDLNGHRCDGCCTAVVIDGFSSAAQLRQIGGPA